MELIENFIPTAYETAAAVTEVYLLRGRNKTLAEQIYCPFYYFLFENFIVRMQIKHTNASRNHNLLFQDRLNKWQLRSGAMLNDLVVMQY
jgi:hypothetical protein